MFCSQRRGCGAQREEIISYFCNPRKNYSFNINIIRMSHTPTSISQSLNEFAFKNLKEIILPYWLQHAPDKKYGGLVGEINNNNQINPDAPKGLILNSRVLWTFSACYGLLKEDRLMEMAQNTFNYLERFYDSENKGYYWSLDSKGNPLDTKKQTYAQAFTMYGLSEYYAVSSDPVALEKAIDIFKLMESKCLDKKYGGYMEAFTRTWEPIEDMRLSDKDLNAEKTMNTHLHVLEAYTNLYKVWKDKMLEAAIRALLDVFRTYFVNTDDYHLNLFYDIQWNSLSSQISYGHDIEATWLLHESAVELHDKELVKTFEDIALKMADASLEGYIEKGAIIYEWHRGGHGEKDDELEWWVQAEAIVGLYNAWEISSDQKYLQTALKILGFIESYLINREFGEWHCRVTQDGTPIKSHPIIGFWKCPYHNARMCLEIIRRTQEFLK
jgi:cellobiose epimerase